MFFVIAVIVLIFVVIFQIAKASEYVSILKGEEVSRRQNNKINGFLMIVFLVLGLVGVWWCNELYYDQTLLDWPWDDKHYKPSASKEGVEVDKMLWITLIVTGIVFIITQVLLFWFAYRYQESDKRKVFYFPHNTRLEIIWTVIPAIALTVLVVIGLRNWFIFTGDAPDNAIKIEVTGKQFSWMFRYPGKNKEFGKKYFRLIDEAAGNQLGLMWRDTTISVRNSRGGTRQMNFKADPFGFDDIVTTNTLYIPKGKPVKFIINSRDVIHSVGLPHFRMKMDAVPGTPTTLWFTPQYTTEEMKEITGNPNFVYELACDQMCGNNHYSMKGTIVVVSENEYNIWLATQKAAYRDAFPDLDPANQKKPAAGDSANANRATAQVSN